MTTEIDPKGKYKVIEENIKLRKKLKDRNEEDDHLKTENEQSKINLFKPIIESNQKLQTETLVNQNKIIDTLKHLKINDKPKFLEIEPKKNKDTIVSPLISNYMRDVSDRSEAGYSIKFDNKTKNNTIGNTIIRFENNNLKIGNKIYSATEGLMELLLKKSPNTTVITDLDYYSYKQILLDTNAMHIDFDKSKRKISDKSDKYKIIKKLMKINDDDIDIIND
jgi:hypothetical protein